MKRIAKYGLFAAVLAVAASIVLPMAFVTLRWLEQPTKPLVAPTPGNDDFSRLNRTHTARVVTMGTLSIHARLRNDTPEAERDISRLELEANKAGR